MGGKIEVSKILQNHWIGLEQLKSTKDQTGRETPLFAMLSKMSFKA